jgi:(5-formylfuran-3-yl)methyl phosphate synthase
VTGLLVSVRDAAEAEAAWRGGATLIDVKEPRHGSLGRATTEQWQEVARCVAGRVPLSVAAGELLEDPPVSAAALASITYIKCGLAGCGTVRDWPDRWRGWLRRLPPDVRPVAVAYADWQRARAPAPRDVARWAGELGCSALLWDTHGKDGTWLLDHVTDAALNDVLGVARRAGLLIVLAGSLSLARVPAVLRFAPDYLAVRGAACAGDRAGQVSEQLVGELMRAVTGAVPSACSAACGGECE